MCQCAEDRIKTLTKNHDVSSLAKWQVTLRRVIRIDDNYWRIILRVLFEGDSFLLSKHLGPWNTLQGHHRTDLLPLNCLPIYNRIEPTLRVYWTILLFPLSVRNHAGQVTRQVKREILYLGNIYISLTMIWEHMMIWVNMEHIHLEMRTITLLEQWSYLLFIKCSGFNGNRIIGMVAYIDDILLYA